MLEIMVAVSVKGNPGLGAFGMIITDMRSGEVWPGISRRLDGTVTNIGAEMAAVSTGLQLVIDEGEVHDLRILIATTGTIDIIQRALDDDQELRPEQKHLQPWFDRIVLQAKKLARNGASIELVRVAKESLLAAKRLAKEAF